MKKITVLIKPVSSMCNMECSYCFYKDLKKYNQHNIGKMTCETCCSIVEKTLSYSVEPIEIEYCFQGGEPLLAGIEFYNFFIELVKEKNKDHIIRYSIQTNGILLNDKWISLFKKNDFLVGISLDGIKKTHDHSRKIKCSGSFEEVIKSVQLLKKNDVNFNVLSVITPYMIKFAKEIYKFYCEEGFDYVQFIPCLPSLDGGEGLLPQQYFEFYKNLYDEYRKNSCLHISLFDQISNLINGEKNAHVVC